MNHMNEICLVEDDKIQIFLIEKFLKKFGYTGLISFYENGKLAYEEMNRRFENHKSFPDLIFLDLNMPIWDGWLFLDEFNKLPGSQYSTIYILTSSLSEDDLKKAEDRGFTNRYLQKPLDFTILKNILQSY